jgi:tripartite-type tricarboxylate transporter receptor subunit TctC
MVLMKRAELRMDLRRRQFLQIAGGAAAWRASVTSASAQSWPGKTVRAIIPFSPGSAADIIPRAVFNELSNELGQPIIVDNRAGAGGAIGMAEVARAEPDGYVLLANSSAHTIVPSLYKYLPFNTAQDLAGVIPLGNLPNVLVVAPSKGFKTIQALAAAAKANNGAMSYSSTGVGSATQFAAERFRLSAGFDGIHVPFRGGAESLTETVTGRVDFCFSPITIAMPFIQNGGLLALAVSTPKRASGLPDTPTTLESGFANSDYTFWVALFAPVKTPRPVVQLLHDRTSKVLRSASMREKMTRFGVDPMEMSPEELDAMVKAEIPVNAAIIKAGDLKAE